MDKAQQLKETIQDADLVLVGIGEEFNEQFSNIGEYAELVEGLKVIDEQERLSWMIPFLEKAYLEQQSESQVLKAYRNLYDIIKDKNYFIVTTCIDGNVRKAGFDNARIVEPCGGYFNMQCSEKCHTELYNSDGYVTKIRQGIQNGTLQQLEQPCCPKCGKPFVFNNIMSGAYVEEGYLPQWEVYTKWLQRTLNKKLCILELGVGMGVPSVIRWPFEKIAFYNKKASFFRINETLYQLTEEIGDKGVSIEGNAQEFLLNKLV